MVCQCAGLTFWGMWQNESASPGGGQLSWEDACVCSVSFLFGWAKRSRMWLHKWIVDLIVIAGNNGIIQLTYGSYFVFFLIPFQKWNFSFLLTCEGVELSKLETLTKKKKMVAREENSVWIDFASYGASIMSCAHTVVQTSVMWRWNKWVLYWSET